MDNENVEEERRAQNPEDDEISLIDLLAVLLRYRWLIIITTALGMIFAVVFSAISIVLPPETKKSYLPDLYASEVLVFIGGKNSYGELVKKFVGTNSFLDAVVDEFDLLTRFEMEKHPRAESRKALQKLITVEFDNRSSVLSISFTDEDPEIAKKVVDFSVKLIENMLSNLNIDKNLEQNIDNSYKEILNLQEKSLESEAQKEMYIQLRMQYELLKLKMDSEKPVFQIIGGAEIGGAEIGGGKFKHRRRTLCIIITFAAFFISVFIAFALNAVENIRKDPEAMEKLRSGMKVGSRK